MGGGHGLDVAVVELVDQHLAGAPPGRVRADLRVDDEDAELLTLGATLKHDDALLAHG
ncbi:hypothetical protein D3C72_2452970 [compost metagenome]